MPMETVYRQIAESIGDAILVADHSGTITYANPAAAGLTGLPVSRLRQLRCQQFLAGLALSPEGDLTLPVATAFRARVQPPASTAAEVSVAATSAEGLGVPGGYVLVLRSVADNAQLARALSSGDDAQWTVLDAIPTATMQLDTRWRVLGLNDACARLFGQPPTALVGGDVLSLMPPEKADQSRAQWEQVVTSGKPSRYLEELGGRSLVTDAYPILDTDGNVTRLSLFAHEFTDRARAERELHESEEQFRAAFENAPIGMGLVSVRGAFLTANRALCDMIGCTANDLTETPLTDVAHPSDVTLTNEQLAALLDGEKETCRFEERWFHQDGHMLWVDLSAVLLRDTDGEPRHYVVHVQDITDRRRAQAALGQSEARLRAVIENMPVMIDAFDEDLHIIYWNRECEAVTGYSAAEIVGNPAALEMLYPDPEYRTGRRQELLNPGGDADEKERHITCKDGTVRTIAWTNVAGRIPVAGWASWGVGTDVTDRRRAEDAQRLATVGQLASGVAHEFNNLLAALMLQAELVSEAEADAESQRLAYLVRRAAKTGGDICRDLTVFARPSEPTREPVRVETVLDNTLALAERQLENAEITVNREYQTDGRHVLADPKQLEQVLLNLLINAQHAMPGGGTLTVEVRHVAQDDGEGHVAIAVTDTGTGIPPEHLRRIFEPFFTTKGRLGSSDTPGTGLGLSVAHGIITAHEGEIRVESEMGVGTTFEIVLPAHTGMAQPEAETATETPATRTSERGTTHVLVAEDAKMLSSLMRAILLGHGHEVTCVDHTEAAIMALQADRFDLVITDLLMPGGGGREVLSFARSLTDPPPVLIVTGITEKHVERETLEMGAAGYIRKPFTRAELSEAVEMVLNEEGA